MKDVDVARPASDSISKRGRPLVVRCLFLYFCYIVLLGCKVCNVRMRNALMCVGRDADSTRCKTQGRGVPSPLADADTATSSESIKHAMPPGEGSRGCPLGSNAAAVVARCMMSNRDGDGAEHTYSHTHGIILFCSEAMLKNITFPTRRKLPRANIPEALRLTTIPTMASSYAAPSSQQCMLA